MEGKPVAGFVRYGPHLGQLVRFEFGPFIEQKRGCLGQSVIKVVLDGLIVAFIGNNPVPVLQVAPS